MNVSQISRVLPEFFSEIAEREARKTGFVRKSSAKIDGMNFLQLLVLCAIDNPSYSFGALSSVFNNHTRKTISRQSLQERCNSNAVKFMEVMLSQAIKMFVNKHSPEGHTAGQFRSIKIVDATSLELPFSMRREYPGSGGSASAAAMKLQTELNYTRGCLGSMVVTDGCTPDTTQKDHLANLEKGDLLLRDMGYFSQEHFVKIDEAGAYYISRVPSSVSVMYEGKLLEEHLYRCKTSAVDITAQVGKRHIFEARVIAMKLPGNIVRARRSRARQDAKRKGRKVSEKSLKLLSWGIYITNIPASMLSADEVYQLYRVRWQIELFFKTWKGAVCFGSIRTKKRNSTLCCIYARIIAALVMMYISGPVQWAGGREVSYTKAYHFIQMYGRYLLASILSVSRMKRCIKKILEVLKTHAMKDRKRSAAKPINYIKSGACHA